MEIVWSHSATRPHRRTSQDKCAADDGVCPCHVFPMHLQTNIITFFPPCRRCRIRKKRCYHGKESKDDVPSAKGQSQGSDSTTRASTPGHGRVCEYNPESVLEELSETSPDVPIANLTSQGRQAAPFGPAISIQKSLTDDQRLKRQLRWYEKQKFRQQRSNIPPQEKTHLEESGAFLQLPHSTVAVILSIYMSCLNDLIPIVDGGRLLRENSNGCASRYLVRAICLVTCKEKQAAPFLRLASDGPLLLPLDFAAKLLQGLEAAICADLEPDKMVKVQILALMHLHNDGTGGGNRASSHLSRAIHEAWSISLHWQIPGNTDQEQSDLLWWTLRNLDKLNKPVMAAAPFMLDDTDIGIERISPRADDYRSRVATVATTLGDLVKSATKVYKATRKLRSDDADVFPELKELTAGTDFEGFHKMHKCYFEIWYYVAAMLSCRYSGPGTVPYKRRLAAADGIIRITSEYGADTLPPLPLIPYAVSLSSTMVYRALRDGQRQVELVYQDLTRCCDILATLAPVWTCVRGVEKLARRLLKLLSHPRPAIATNTGGPSSAAVTPSMISDQTQQSYQDNDDFTQQDTTSGLLQVSGQFSEPLEYSTSGITPAAAWSGTDMSYFQFDAGFHEMFDGGVPNVFRGHATWEMLSFFSDDESSCAPDLGLAQSNDGLNGDFNMSANHTIQ